MLKTISTTFATASVWIMSTAAVRAGEIAAPPVAKADNGNGAVVLFLVLGALIVVGGIMKPKAPPPGDQG